MFTLEWHVQDKYNGLSFTMERPRTCPIPFLCWPFNCTILCPLKLFVRSTDGKLGPSSYPPTKSLSMASVAHGNKPVNAVLCMLPRCVLSHIISFQPSGLSQCLPIRLCVIIIDCGYYPAHLLGLPLRHAIYRRVCCCRIMHGYTSPSAKQHGPMPLSVIPARKHGLCGCAGDVLGYAEQVTKCCNCSAFIKVFDAANHCIYTLEGRASLRPHPVVRQPNRVFIFSHLSHSESLNTPLKCS